ncbi:hypothetical protein BDV98DRAFT_583648 [Pterulicium gracile]|uniref:Uncharacterized protein n=1 Tax=Pterulicium gracile TaxID=1884261 RepID=A0A5C3QGQ7_9AGAR|nr:hypothetical protein BDV98DRAFT_583648 [Pterula gracilis]
MCSYDARFAAKGPNAMRFSESFQWRITALRRPSSEPGRSRARSILSIAEYKLGNRDQAFEVEFRGTGGNLVRRTEEGEVNQVIGSFEPVQLKFPYSTYLHFMERTVSPPRVGGRYAEPQDSRAKARGPRLEDSKHSNDVPSDTLNEVICIQSEWVSQVGSSVCQLHRRRRRETLWLGAPTSRVGAQQHDLLKDAYALQALCLVSSA